MEANVLVMVARTLRDRMDDITGETELRLDVEDIARDIGNAHFFTDSPGEVKRAVDAMNAVPERTARDSKKLARYLYDALVRLFPIIDKKYKFVMPS